MPGTSSRERKALKQVYKKCLTFCCNNKKTKIPYAWKTKFSHLDFTGVSNGLQKTKKEKGEYEATNVGRYAQLVTGSILSGRRETAIQVSH